MIFYISTWVPFQTQVTEIPNVEWLPLAFLPPHRKWNLNINYWFNMGFHDFHSSEAWAENDECDDFNLRLWELWFGFDTWRKCRMKQLLLPLLFLFEISSALFITAASWLRQIGISWSVISVPISWLYYTIFDYSVQWLFVACWVLLRWASRWPGFFR